MPIYTVETDRGTFSIETDAPVASPEEMSELVAEQLERDTTTSTTSTPTSRTFLQDAAPAAIRAVTGISGSLVAAVPSPVTTPSGGAIGAGGEYLAQKVEQFYGDRDKVNPASVTVAGGLAALPAFGGPAATLGANVVKRAAQGGAMGGAASVATELAETGELPTLERGLASVALGAVVGGVGGDIEASVSSRMGRAVEQAATPPPVVDGVPIVNSSGDPRVEALLLDMAMGRKLDPIESGVVRQAFPGMDDTKIKFEAVRVRETHAPELVGPPPPRPPEQLALFTDDGRVTPDGIANVMRETSTSATNDVIKLDVQRQLLQTARALDASDAAKEGQRFFRQLGEILHKGEIDAPGLVRVLARSNRTLKEFLDSDWYRSQSEAGRVLNRLSQMKKMLAAAAAKDPETDKVLAGLTEVADAGWFSKAVRLLRWQDDRGRIQMIGQFVTGLRNAVTGVPTYGSDMVAGALANAMPAAWGGGRTDPWAHLMALGSALKPGQTKMIKEALANNPIIEHRLLGTNMTEAVSNNKLILGEVAGATMDRFEGALTWFGRQFESYFRRAKFQAVVNPELAKLGKTYNAATEWNLGNIRAEVQALPDWARQRVARDLEPIFDRGVRGALEVVFQSDPRSKIGEQLLDSFIAMRPVTTAVHAYPRYFQSAFNFMLDYSPFGATRLLGKNYRAERGAEIAGRALVGTGILSAAMALRFSPAAGEKWYEVKTDDDKRVDLRGLLGPYLGPLFVAELIKQKVEGTDTLTSEDWLQGISGVNRTPTIIKAATDTFSAAGGGNFERTKKAVQRMVGEYVGRYTIPLRTLKDILAGAGYESEGAFYDPAEPLEIGGTETTAFNPTIQNIPFLGAHLDRPTSVEPATGKERHAEAPLQRQFTAVVEETRSPLQNELDRLGYDKKELLPRTGIAKLDRELSRRFGAVVEFAAPNLINSPEYQAANANLQKLLLSRLFVRAREAARNHLEKSNPDLGAVRKLGDKYNQKERAVLKDYGVDIAEAARRLTRYAPEARERPTP